MQKISQKQKNKRFPMNRRNYKRANNKKGFTILLIMIVLLIVVFWRITSGSEVIIAVAGQQKAEMNKNNIVVDMTELPEFEMN